MTNDLDIDERRALASPRDWPEDFSQPTGWNACCRCLHLFISIATRTLCKQCAERKDHDRCL